MLDVTGPVLYIDAPSVEQWLARKGHERLGIDQRSYTIYFVNWYSRQDFKFHVYTKTDEPDPDTGYNFGVLRAVAQDDRLGRHRHSHLVLRPSAGPEAWSGSWNVDDADLDGDELARLPHPTDLGVHQGRLPQPVEAEQRPGPGDALRRHQPALHHLAALRPAGHDAGTAAATKSSTSKCSRTTRTATAATTIDADFIHSKLRAFEPYYDWQVRVSSRPSARPRRQAGPRASSPACSSRTTAGMTFGDPFAELFCYFDANLDTYVPPTPATTMSAGLRLQHHRGDMGDQFGLLGFADDNWVDGTQSFVFEFDSAEHRELGYGFSTTTIHEVGHHIGMSHPHDGYDSERSLDYDATGDF